MATERPTIPIICTKLCRPSVAAHILCRERLHAEIERGCELPMTLASAPAAYGKSTAITHWLEEEGVPSAWVPLDEGDSDQPVFLSYLVGAIRTLFARACRDTAAWTDASEMPLIATLSGNLGEDTQ